MSRSLPYTDCIRHPHRKTPELTGSSSGVVPRPLPGRAAGTMRQRRAALGLKTRSSTNGKGPGGERAHNGHGSQTEWTWQSRVGLFEAHMSLLRFAVSLLTIPRAFAMLIRTQFPTRFDIVTVFTEQVLVKPFRRPFRFPGVSGSRRVHLFFSCRPVVARSRFVAAVYCSTASLLLRIRHFSPARQRIPANPEVRGCFGTGWGARNVSKCQVE